MRAGAASGLKLVYITNGCVVFLYETEPECRCSRDECLRHIHGLTNVAIFVLDYLVTLGYYPRNTSQNIIHVTPTHFASRA